MAQATGTEYTAGQATDEALLLLTRKLRRLYPDVLADLVKRLPDGAHTALNMADIRADTLRASDQREGITRTYPDPFMTDDSEE